MKSVAISNGLPLSGGFDSPLVLPEATAKSQSPPRTQVRFCSDRYQETIGLKVIAGRDLSAGDIDGSRKVALVNQTFVKLYFAGAYPIGRTIGLARLSTMREPVADPTFEVIGVVPDVTNQGIREPPAPEAYVPYPFRGVNPFTLVVRTAGEPLALVASIRQQLRGIDPSVALVSPDTLENAMQQVFYAQPRFVLIVLGMFAVSGLLLVALGIYGVLAYTVSQQTREIAIRIAMGGERRDVLRLVVGGGLRLVAIGMAIGMAVSFGTNQLLTAQLWKTSPSDGPTLVAVAMIIGIVGACAAWLPARRATRVEPIVALRHE